MSLSRREEVAGLSQEKEGEKDCHSIHESVGYAYSKALVKLVFFLSEGGVDRMSVGRS